MAKLTDREVINLIREEYEKKTQEVFDELDIFVKLGSLGEINVLSPGLKIREKKSSLLYTISVVKPEGIDCIGPEGKVFFIKNEELRNRYVLD